MGIGRGRAENNTRSRVRVRGCLYGGGSALTIGRASPLCRDPASQLNSSSKFVLVYIRRGPAFLGGISLFTTEISPRRAGNFPYKCTTRADSPIGGLASQSSVHTTKLVLTSIF